MIIVYVLIKFTYNFLLILRKHINQYYTQVVSNFIYAY